MLAVLSVTADRLTGGLIMLISIPAFVTFIHSVQYMVIKIRKQAVEIINDTKKGLHFSVLCD